MRVLYVYVGYIFVVGTNGVFVLVQRQQRLFRRRNAAEK